MFWPWLHLIVVIILIIAVISGLRKNGQHPKVWAMIARLCYLMLLISGVVMLPYPWHEHPLLTIIKLLAALIFIGIIEMAFAKKQQHQLTSNWLWLMLLGAVIVITLGFWLTSGFPLF